MYTYGIFKNLIFNKKVVVVWPLLESHQIYQDVKDKLQHLILQVANRRKQNVHNVLNLMHAQNANTGQFIPAIPQRFFFISNCQNDTVELTRLKDFQSLARAKGLRLKFL